MSRNIKLTFLSLLIFSSSSFAMDLSLEDDGFFSNTQVKQKEKYTEAFEIFAKGGCRKLTCDIVREPGKYVQRTYEKPVGFGASAGPFGIPTHYAKVPVTTIVLESAPFKCGHCGKIYYDDNSYNLPLPYVTIFQEGNTRVMTISDGTFARLRPMCKAPLLDGDLKLIWDNKSDSEYAPNSWSKTLEAMWKTARQLDIQNGCKPNNNIIYIVNSSGCTLL